MWGILRTYRLACMLVMAWSFALLSGCHPSYMMDETERYARGLGVLERYDIQRNHDRGLSRNSRLCVVINKSAGADVAELAQVVRKSIAPYFSSVTSIDRPLSRASAVRQIKTGYAADFLFYLDLLDSDVTVHRKEPEKGQANEEAIEKPDGSSQVTESVAYDQLKLLITIVDVNNGAVFDHIQMNASGTLWPSFDQSIDELLSGPMAYLARQLTGMEE